ncbi:unnamed protein product [Coregonus sp. 'balchen']|nr:unnamed protein product [Coregonus sp. 'balchen']
MDVELKLEVDERDMPISPAVINADLFDTQAGYRYYINPHETTPQQLCGILSKDSVARDVEIKAESIGLNTIGAQDREITDNVLIPSINSLSQAVGVKRVILIHVIVHTEQDNPSTSVKDKACFEIPHSDTQIGKLQKVLLLEVKSNRLNRLKKRSGSFTDVPQSAVETATLGLKNGPTDICIKDERNVEFISTQHVKMETISIDTDVSLSDEEAGHRPRRDRSFMTSTTEDETMELYPLCKEIGLDLEIKTWGKIKT